MILQRWWRKFGQKKNNGMKGLSLAEERNTLQNQEELGSISLTGSVNVQFWILLSEMSLCGIQAQFV